AIFLLALAVFAAPYFGFVHREPQIALTERFTSVLPALFHPAVADTRALFPRLFRALLFYNLEGESWPAANLPGTPALDPITGVLFALGLAMAAASFWRGWNALLVFWFLTVFIGGGVLPAEFRSHRIALAMPVVYLLAGLFVQQLQCSWRELAPRPRSLTAGLLGLLLLSAALVNPGIFFGQQVHDPRTRAEFDRDISALANALAGFHGQRYIYLMANFPFYNPGQDFAWLAGEPPGRRIMSLTEALPSREDAPMDLLYVACLPYDGEALAAAVRAFYPGVQELSLESPYGRYSCRLVLVSRSEAAAGRGLMARFLSEDGGESTASHTVQVPALEAEWEAGDIPLAPPFRVQWEGALYIPLYDMYLIRTAGSVPMEVWVDGQPADSGALRLAEGWHTLRAAGQVERFPAVVSLWWKRGEGAWEKVPPAYLDASADIPGIDAVFSACDGGGSDGPAWQRIEPLIALQTVPSEWESAPAKALAGRRYCAVYKGKIRADQAGRYGFRAVAQAGSVRLLLDGRPVLEDAGRPWATAETEGEVSLTPGWHALHLEYRRLEGEFGGVTLYWRPPAGEWAPVPPTALSRALTAEAKR
ncbi:MAG: PA14 domain-containing protein, partial [Anaerolineae bacterium]